LISSKTEQLVVVRRPVGFTWIERPLSGAAGLMTDTSNAGVASAGIGCGGGGDSGTTHAVAGVARISTSGNVTPWANVPMIV